MSTRRLERSGSVGMKAVCTHRPRTGHPHDAKFTSKTVTNNRHSSGEMFPLRIPFRIFALLCIPRSGNRVHLLFNRW
eukprot:3140500-Rhodomonas_salina.2